MTNKEMMMDQQLKHENVHVDLAGKRRAYTEEQYNALKAERNQLLDECDRLRRAIKKHRRDMWGAQPIGHLYDRVLYNTLQGK